LYDVVIIGGGPGGYAAALYAHNFGLSVAMVEKDRVGGTCLVRGCIPAKSWLQTAEIYQTVANSETFGVESGEPKLDWESALNRKNTIVDGLVKGLSGLLRTRGVEVIDGFGRIVDGQVEVAVDGGELRTLEAKHIIVATGSVPASIPGYDVDGEWIVTSDEALDWADQPGRVAIIGAGAIGVEFASLLADVGTEVHLFEMEDQVLPGMEPEAAKALTRALKKKGVSIHTSTMVGPAEISGATVTVPFGDDAVSVDVVLVAVGRRPVTEGIGLEGAGIDTERGFVTADPATMQTANPAIYAIGDIVAGTAQLAHVGFAEGIAAITHIAEGVNDAVNYRAIPMVVYSHPEVASVGLTEAEAVAEGYEVETTSHGMRALGRSIIHDETGGTVKIVAEKDGPVLGATVVDPLAGEIIHELMYVVGWEAMPSEAAAFVHAHPTVSEAIGETLMASAGRPLH
jgi:dihydrolipoamide dehydrogenase